MTGVQTCALPIWPLKVESGVIECLSNDAVVFKVGKSIYAINGVAKSYAKEYGYLSVSQIWKDDQTFYQMAKEIADTDPNVSIKDVLNKMGKIPKMNIDPILSSGIELCK